MAWTIAKKRRKQRVGERRFVSFSNLQFLGIELKKESSVLSENVELLNFFFEKYSLARLLGFQM